MLFVGVLGECTYAGGLGRLESVGVWMVWDVGCLGV